MDPDGTSLTNKDTDTAAAETLCPMDIASPSQVQNMDTSQDVVGNLDDAAELKSDENCVPAVEDVACNEPANIVIAEPAVPCRSVPDGADVEMQCSTRDSSQRMEIDGQENADTREGACSLIQKEVSEEVTAACQSGDASNPSVCKTAAGGQESETLPTVAQPDADKSELTDGNEQLFLNSNAADGDFVSSGITPTNSGKNVSNVGSFQVTAVF